MVWNMSLPTDFQVDRTPFRRKATYQDVLDAPENKVAEIIGKNLFLMPRPTRLNAAAGFKLSKKIGIPFQDEDDPGGWKFLPEPEIRFSENFLVADIAGWRMPQDLGAP